MAHFFPLDVKKTFCVEKLIKVKLPRHFLDLLFEVRQQLTYSGDK